jgi:acyl phosphate:glycerol-3-phosphate acyltransferase
MTTLAVIVIAYLIGSVPTGYLVTRAVVGSDIRTTGSGGTGATNVQRLLGWRWGLGIALADLVKGSIVVVLARSLGVTDLTVAIAASLAVVGHCWPVWLGFRGGKGVATGAGAAFALSFWALLLIPVLAAPIVATRYVSLGSVIAAGSAAVLFSLLAVAGLVPLAYVAFGFAAAGIVIGKHRSNIQRLRAGTERRIGGSRGTATLT